MQKYFDINEEDHSIRCKAYYQDDLHKATHWVIATYGFGGNKDNHAVQKFADRITTKYNGYGVLCFDWPCHGKDARNRLILSECLEYLDLVNRYAKETLGAYRLYNYSASLGAYLTLLYLHEISTSAGGKTTPAGERRASEEKAATQEKQQESFLPGNPYDRIVLRCPAIKLGRIMYDQMSPEEKEKFDKKGEVKLGYERKILITKDFMDDLNAHDITKYEYFDDADRILILHGTKDKMAPFEEAAAFADNNVIEFVPVENADHPFTDPDTMDFAIQKTIAFFAP